MERFWKRLLPLLFAGLLGGVLAPSCRATTITFDFSNIHWVNSYTSEAFEIYFANPGSNVTIGLNPASGPASVTPTVADAYGAVESRLQINVGNTDQWGLLGIRADLHFYGSMAQLSIQTVGRLAPGGSDYSGLLSSYQVPTTLGSERYWANNAGEAGAGSILFNSLLPSQGLITQTDTFMLSSITKANLFAWMVNSTANAEPPPFSGYADPYFGSFDPNASADNPEPASLVLLGTGVLMLGVLGRRARAKRVQETA